MTRQRIAPEPQGWLRAALGLQASPRVLSAAPSPPKSWRRILPLAAMAAGVGA